MLNLQRLLRDDRLLRALTGLNRKALDTLTPVFAEALAKAPIPRRHPSPRQRAQGAGRTPRLSTVTDKLIYILFYFKCYPTFDLAGMLFDLDRSQANRWVHRLQPILEAALGTQMVLPERKLTCVEDFIERFPKVTRVMLDGTERPIQRSCDPEKQRQDYSGKKKRHTRSHLGAVDPNKRILVLSHAYAGKAHDKGILNQEQWAGHLPSDVKIQADSGFQGLQEEYVNVEIPYKKPKGGELSNEQKQENQQLARERVGCEHAFAGLKRYNIVYQVYRNRIEGFDDRSMVTAAGLWNFYLTAA
ncbi:MAG: transposase family protein [Elainellaceae cyanobacterium]